MTPAIPSSLNRLSLLRPGYGGCQPAPSPRGYRGSARAPWSRSWSFPLLLVSLAALANACEIKFSPEDPAKERYQSGEVVIFKLRMELTHNDCPVLPKETVIQGMGVKILGATDWKNTAPNIWERRLKTQITSGSDGKLTFTAKRSCDKDGAFAACSFRAEPVTH